MGNNSNKSRKMDSVGIVRRTNHNSEFLLKLKDHLKVLFQFDCADLDFGIYRIINYKRKEIEKFIEDDLIGVVEKEFERYKVQNQKELLERIEEKRKEIRKLEKELGEKILKDSEIEEKFRDRPFAKEYLELKKQIDEIGITETIQSQVFNDLYNFFSRYYEDGDFISKRRYSSRQNKYAIPYSGEEVKLYWANFDQYYIKTDEVFKDYEFNQKGWKFVFRTVLADVEAGNVKGNRRYFFLFPDEPVKISNKACLIKFEYRMLTNGDLRQYPIKTKEGKAKTTGITQDELNPILKDKILALITTLEPKAILTETQDEKTILEKHLYKYTRKITSDFFIHKNLKEFLERELDYFIKTEVLDIESFDTEKERYFDRHITRFKVVKNISERIIEFLSQIEDYQKMLWEKKKFVLKTDYVITIDRIPEDFYKEILENKEQLKEWQELGFGNIAKLKDLIDKEDLIGKTYKKLPIDTKYFSKDFKEKLLEKSGEKGKLDDLIDGILIKSENWQALNLILERYREQLKCIHIDPPYNTQTSGFLYKNDYQHSSWLAMMENRIRDSFTLLSAEGAYLCHIDENEYERLHLLFDTFSVPSAGTMVWDKRNPMTAGRGVATQHEYIIWRSRTDRPINLRSKNIQAMLNKVAELIKKYGKVTEKAKKEYAGWVSKTSELSGGEKAYRFLDEKGRIYRGVSLRAPEPRTDPKFFKPLIHPITGKPCAVPPNGFSRTPETLQSMLKRGEIIFGSDETTQPQQKRFLSAESKRQISSVIQDAKRGKADLDALGLENFPYCHSVSLYMELIGAAASNSFDIVLDFFAGSGTTAHAVMKLNKEDGGKRKYILVEMADYFDTVIIPRIKKTAYSFNWKDGKPQGADGISQIIKYHYLEQYEDSLHNIEFPQEEKAQKMLEFFSEEAKSEYLMKYMLKFETEGSPSLLNLQHFESPFEYKLKIISNSRGEEIVNVDLVETFNYLVGLKIDGYKFLKKNGRKYVFVFGERNNRRTAIVWRSFKNIDLKKDKEIIDKELANFNPDEIFINGDSFVKGYKPIESEFKTLMGV